MKTQVLFIHGGEMFATYGDYLQFLKDFEIDFDAMEEKRWKHSLADELGEGFEVVMPTMPSKWNAKYAEWKIWFEKYTPYLRDGVILVGHSLGGTFLAKYLSENDFPKEIRATFLVSPPFDEETSGHSFADFVLPDSPACAERSAAGRLKKFEDQGGEIVLYHSEDDTLVPLAAFEKYKKALPSAEAVLFHDRSHFLQSEFPEIVEKIKDFSGAN